MQTQAFMGRHSLIDRLAAQMGDRDAAIAVLQKRGHVDAKGSLTALGKERDAMTAQERAVDRAAKKTGKSPRSFKYDPTTNRATLKKHY